MPVTLKSRLPTIVTELQVRMDPAVRAAAEGIAAHARARVPVGAPEVHIRDAIHVKFESPSTYSVVAGDSQAWYGHFVEFGTVKAAPHPFLVPAAEDGRPEAVALVRSVLRGL